MIRKCLVAAVALVFTVGLVAAEEFTFAIKKVEDGKLVGLKFAGKDDKKGTETTLSVAPDAKVVSAKFDKETKKLVAGDALEGGLKNKMFTEIGDKGVRARVVTGGDGKVTEIRVFQRKKTN